MRVDIFKQALKNRILDLLFLSFKTILKASQKLASFIFFFLCCLLCFGFRCLLSCLFCYNHLFVRDQFYGRLNFSWNSLTLGFTENLLILLKARRFSCPFERERERERVISPCFQGFRLSRVVGRGFSQGNLQSLVLENQHMPFFIPEFIHQFPKRKMLFTTEVWLSWRQKPNKAIVGNQEGKDQLLPAEI